MSSTDGLKRLVERAQTGDRSAFDQLTARCASHVVAIVETQLGGALRSRTSVDDVRQETFLRAYRGLNTFLWRGERSFFAWLKTIARHVILEAAERERRRPTLPLTVDVPGDQLTQSRAQQQNERFDRLEDALESLPPDYRDAIYLARVEGLQIKEIARRLEKSPNAVSHLLLRALRLLRERFGDTESLGLPPRMFQRGDEGASDGTT